MKILIIANADSPQKEVGTISQVLQEYDYEVVNPTVIEVWEEVRMDLAGENDWYKRLIRLSMNCDGAVCLADWGNRKFEKTSVLMLNSLPWIGIQKLEGWVEYEKN